MYNHRIFFHSFRLYFFIFEKPNNKVGLYVMTIARNVNGSLTFSVN